MSDWTKKEPIPFDEGDDIPIVPEPPADDTPPPVENRLPRIFVREPGWKVVQKIGSTREFCYQMSPGEDWYHRLADGELYLAHADEKLCLPCAERRGILEFQPRPLRPAPTTIVVLGSPEDEAGFDVLRRVGPADDTPPPGVNGFHHGH